MKTAIILLSIIVLCAGCETAPIEPPSEKHPTSKRIEAPFAAVWSATLETLFNEAPLSVVSREERLIATDWQYGKSDYVYYETAPFGLGGKEYRDSRFRMNVRLGDEKGATRVTIKLIEEVRESRRGSTADDVYEAWTPIETSTLRERALLEKIESLARPPVRQGQKEEIEAKLKELLDAGDREKAAAYLKGKIEFDITNEALKKHFRERLEGIEMQPK